MYTEAIWKFPLNVTDMNRVVMPMDSEILSIQTQDDIPCIWALVNPKKDKTVRAFEIFGTGHPITTDIGTDRKYLATFQISNGLVFHVFERLN